MKTILVDQDGVIAYWDEEFMNRMATLFPEAEPLFPAEERKTFNLYDQFRPEHHYCVDEAMNDAGFYSALHPVVGAAEALNEMLEMGFDVSICTSPWLTNLTCASDKLQWVEDHMGAGWGERMIITRDKTRVRGDVLIDDKPSVTGVMQPQWTHVLFDQPYNRDLTLPRVKDWGTWKDTVLPLLEN